MDNRDETYYKDLITSYLAGEAAPAMVEELTTWVQADPRNEMLFRQLHQTWLLLAKNRIDRIHPDEEWITLQSKLILAGHDDASGKARTLIPLRTLRIAALILLLLIPLAALIYYAVPQRMERLVAGNTLLEQVLPDGSRISLNQGSELIFRKGFRGADRSVVLKGEAWFEVQKQEKPFVVHAGDLRIEVRGTRFMVSPRNGSLLTEVVLESGSVALSVNGPSLAVKELFPGETATFDRSAGTITVTPTTDDNYLAWKTRRIVFDNDPLDTIVFTLNRIYRSNIILGNPVLARCRVTTTFDKQSLESVLKVLEATLDLEVRNTGQAIEITGQGCE